MIKKVIGLTSCMLLGGMLLFAQAPHGIVWSWPAVTADTAGNTISVDGYNLYCATSTAGPFVKANAAIIPSTSFLETGLTVGNTYSCQVAAVKGTVESAHSTTATAPVFQFPPAAPQALSGVIQ